MNDASTRAGLQRQTMQLGETEIELFQGGTGPALPKTGTPGWKTTLRALIV